MSVGEESSKDVTEPFYLLCGERSHAVLHHELDLVETFAFVRPLCAREVRDGVIHVL